jgi:hypothetical protein
MARGIRCAKSLLFTGTRKGQKGKRTEKGTGIQGQWTEKKTNRREKDKKRQENKNHYGGISSKMEK